jgi:hypothetical protein
MCVTLITVLAAGAAAGSHAYADTNDSAEGENYIDTESNAQSANVNNISTSEPINESKDVAIVRSNKAASTKSMVTISGKAVFENTDGQTVPCRKCWVEIIRSSLGSEPADEATRIAETT